MLKNKTTKYLISGFIGSLILFLMIYIAQAIIIENLTGAIISLHTETIETMQEIPSVPDQISSYMPNPSAVYCGVILGYEYKIITNKATGGQYGICIMPDKTECRGWDFYAGTCGEQFNWCTVNGYQSIAMTDGKDSFSPHYTICVLEKAVQKEIEVEIYNELTDTYEYETEIIEIIEVEEVGSVIQVSGLLDMIFSK